MHTGSKQTEHAHGGSEAERKYWLDERQNVNKIVYTLYAVCALLLGAELLYDKQVHFPFENLIGFFGLFGFIACVGLVLAAKQMRKLLRREEDYYER